MREETKVNENIIEGRNAVLEAFRAACQKRGEVPTTEIKKFIKRYIEEAGD